MVGLELLGRLTLSVGVDGVARPLGRSEGCSVFRNHQGGFEWCWVCGGFAARKLDLDEKKIAERPIFITINNNNSNFDKHSYFSTQHKFLGRPASS